MKRIRINFGKLKAPLREEGYFHQTIYVHRYMGPESLKSQENKKSRRNEKLKVKTYQQVGVEILSQ